MFRKVGGFLALLFILSWANIGFAWQVGEVSSGFQLFGKDDRIVVEAFSDPRIKGVTCHICRTKKGGFLGDVGIAEDKSNASIACRQTGSIKVPKGLKQGQEVFKKDTSMFFKKMRVVRFYDRQVNTLIYLVYSRTLLSGSPKCSISTVPIMPWFSKKDLKSDISKISY